MATASDSRLSPLLNTEPRRFYRPELDCLRFFAFFAVFIHHSLAGDAAYYSARHVPLGWLIASAVSAGRFGVDLFFLLSAYLITELLLREREGFGKLDLRSFYIRRILRIWPLYFLGILIAWLLHFVVPDQYFPWTAALGFVFLCGNWLISFGAPFHSPMLALWSVSFEEQFYLFWPALISRTRRNASLIRASVVLIVVATLSRVFFLPHARASHSEVAIFTNTLTRLDPLAFGITAAVLLHNQQVTYAWPWRLTLLLWGTAVWLIAGHYYNLTWTFMLLGYPAISLGALLIFLSFLGTKVVPAWLRYLGKISYGLYVFHELAQLFTVRLFGGYVHTLRAFALYWSVSLAMTVAVSALSYKFFESPFLRLKERFTRVSSRPV